MQTPVQVSFKGLPASPALEQRIRAKSEKLERFNKRLTSVRVLVEALNRQEHPGRVYTVRVDVTVPGAELFASREVGANHEEEDIRVALRDAFDAVTAQLESFTHKQRERV